MSKKVGISDFISSRASSEANESGQPAVAAQTVAERSSASPMLSPSRTSGPIKRTERKTIRLPVTGTEIELTSNDVVPSSCAIHPRNQRVQSLLKLTNPKVSGLKSAIERDGQRDPVLARWVTRDDGSRVVEILDGSRRRFVCDAIHQEDSKTLLRTWIGQIPDADADYLAKAGNDDRDDVSCWEISQYLKRVENENPSWSHEVIAANERMSRTNVTNLLAIADIPIEVVALLESPDLLKVNSGIQVVKLLKTARDKSYIQALAEDAPFTKFSELANRLKSLLNPRASIDMPSANRKIEIKKGSVVRAAIGVNRKNDGQYKVDLYGLSESEYNALVTFLEQTLR